MKKYYIIQEKGFEYNDETYNPVSGGKPIKVYTNSQAAYKDKKQMEFKKLINGIEIIFYGYDPIDNINKFLEVFNSFGKTSITEDDINYDFKLPENLTFEEYLKIKPFINVEFYEVVECDGEE